MKAKRRRHAPEPERSGDRQPQAARRAREARQFKARVALEALRGVKTIQMIAREYGIHPAQVAEWKKTMAAGAASLFGRGAAGGGEEQFERQREELHAKIGQLSVEVDFRRKRSRQFGV